MGWFLLGAPWDSSGTGRGESLAPAALRAAGLTALVDVDRGDAATYVTGTDRDPATGVRAQPQTIAATRALVDALRAAPPGHRPLVVGGDCSLLLGVFAHLGPGAGLWLVDGHPDHLDGHASETGETADMELAILLGGGLGMPPMLAAERVALIGHRTEDLDPASAAEVAALPPRMLTVPAAAVVADPDGAARRAAALARTPMWLHLDLDVLDPSVLPAVTYPQPGGPDLAQLAAVLAPLARSPLLIGISVADFRPDLDPDGLLATRVVALIAGLL